MKKIIFLTAFLLVLACRDEEVGTVAQVDNAPFEITQISFKPDFNTTITDEIVLDFDGVQTFSGYIPYGVSIQSLVASITTSPEGGSIQLDGTLFQNEITAHDFGKEVNVELFNSDQSNSWNYTIRLTYFTGLPILTIDTDGVPVDSREIYTDGTINVFGGLNFEHIETSSVRIRGRGNSTWFLHPKKPYQIKFETKVILKG